MEDCPSIVFYRDRSERPFLECLFNFYRKNHFASLFYFNWRQLFGQSGQIFRPSGVVWSLSIEEPFYIGIAAIILTLQLTIKNARTFIHLLTATVCLTLFLSTMSRMLLAKSDVTAENFGETGNLPRVFLGTDTRISSICAEAVVAISLVIICGPVLTFGRSSSSELPRTQLYK